MPCCLRLLAIRVAPSTSLMLSSWRPNDFRREITHDRSAAKGIRRNGCYAPRNTIEGRMVSNKRVGHAGAMHQSMLCIGRQGDDEEMPPAFCGPFVLKGAAPRVFLLSFG